MYRRLSRYSRLLLLALLTLCFCAYLYLVSVSGSSKQAKSPVKPATKLDPNDANISVGLLLPADLSRQSAITQAFKNAWRAYEQDAMGSDEYHPISHKGSNISLSGGIGYTVVDAIDTMYIMGLSSDYARARLWINKQLTFDREGTFSTFETTIRVLGGLLSTYHLTMDDLYLERAIDLADRILPAFDTHSGLPLPSINLAKKIGVPDEHSPRTISTAEASTLQLEFRYLAELTGNEKYWRKAENAMSVIEKANPPYNLVPIHMNVHDGTFMSSDIRLGSRGDSYYEYLLKQFLQTARTEPIYKKLYEGAMQGVHDRLVQKSPTKGATYISELLPQGSHNGEITWGRQARQDHLVCFLAGSLMLGATTTSSIRNSVSIPPRMDELSPKGQRDWKTGLELLETCMYTHETSTGLSPEIVQFNTLPNTSTGSDKDWYIKNSRKGGPSGYDARYMLRPETVESLFIAWRLTGDVRYRDYSWAIFSSIEKYCRLPGGGYATILDVDTVPVSHDDKQETFFLSETLKYLYLTFANSSVLPLDKYVFNTEAHPLPIFNPSITPAYPSS
ncbi:glycoside hydrolase family 47 protein [Crucibulum laeve]|uniref:alpha-1,2-Mannosidase n=1 Tax=Crucibulum laeve TaxID=68775 RepID=A0A5C3M3H5_9AGAR|nr:glycoside hydrolase family 47 protein [Crucibulum laeve]